MARKIFVGNYKGGVGKTTFTYNIGCELQKRKEKVLLIDLDPQSSLTEVCYGVSDYENFENLSDEETFNNIIDLYCNANRSNIFDRLNLDINKLVKDNGLVKFIPSSYLYKNGGLDIQCLNMKKKSTDMLIIKRFIEDSKVDEIFDYIIFDCPPSNNIITQSGFLASDYYIIPTIMDSISIRGVSHYKEIFDKYYKKYVANKFKIINAAVGKEAILLGVFESKKKGNTTTKRYRDLISNEFHLFESYISDYKEVAENLEKGKQSEIAQFPKLLDEIIDRIESIEKEENK